jgi:hypothetical protein
MTATSLPTAREDGARRAGVRLKERHLTMPMTAQAAHKEMIWDGDTLIHLLSPGLPDAWFYVNDALHIYRALFGFLHGHVLNELQEIVDNPDETDDLLRLGLHRLPIGDFPLLRGLAPVLAAYDGAAELERGLEILLTGLAATLTAPGQARPR